MNTYRPVRVDWGRWAVEWFVDGRSQGFAYGTYPSEAEALFIAYMFARMEMMEARRKPDIA
jgi:hypothetical protein